MTGTLISLRTAPGRSLQRLRPSRRSRAVAATGPVPPLDPRLTVIRAALIVLCSAALTLFLQLTFVGRFQHASAQQQAYDSFRAQLALGTAPTGPADPSCLPTMDDPTPLCPALELGAPVAYLEIPSLGLTEVIGEGTTSGVLFDGPGHRRDTPLPGQVGTSVIMGRRAAFGGPFSGLRHLEPEDTITVTTGQGVFEYTVLGIRRANEPQPAAVAADGSRMVLVTADGPAFMPDDVLRVDADLVGTAVGGAPRDVTRDTLPPEERIMAGDPATLWALAMWLMALTGMATATAWAWNRWGRFQAWIACFPPLLLVGLAAAGEAARLLPNLT